MLFGESAKLTMLLCGLTFAALLMSLQSSTFFGIMGWTYTPVVNIRSKIWVSDPKVEQVNDAKPMRDTDVNRVRSVDGVKWAAPLHSSITQARLLDGNFKLIQLIGIDSTTLAGAPNIMVSGRLEDLRLPNTVIIDEFGAERLGKTDSVTKKLIRPLGVGDTFELNDQEARIVGVCKAKRSFTGGPFVYTTYDRAISYAPAQRRTLSFVLAEPVENEAPASVARRISETTGLRAWTEDELSNGTFWWYWVNTGIPVSFGTTILLGLFVGIAISGQTFYSFVLDNLKYLAALKAMGASTWLLCKMLLLQAFTAGFIGYGLGVGLAQGMGRAMIKKSMPPFVMYPEILIGTFLLIMGISLISALIGIVKVARVDPASVFRG
jgi:putative ABC transport system permease protein